MMIQLRMFLSQIEDFLRKEGGERDEDASPSQSDVTNDDTVITDKVGVPLRRSDRVSKSSVGLHVYARNKTKGTCLNPVFKIM